MSALHQLPGLLVAAAASSSSTKATQSTTSLLLLYVILFGGGYVVWRYMFKPRSAAAQRQRDLLTNLSPGDEVLTAAGIFGTVVEVDQDRVTIETSPGTELTVLRSTIARKVGPSGDGVNDLPQSDDDIEDGDGDSWDEAEDNEDGTWEEEDGDVSEGQDGLEDGETGSVDEGGQSHEHEDPGADQAAGSKSKGSSQA